MAGIHIPKTTGVSIPKPGKIPTPSVPAPALRPKGIRGLTPLLPRPRLKRSSNTRLYAKGVNNGPMGGVMSSQGFGDTGMGGET